MTDCPNAEIRDLLPEWVAGTLPGESRAEVVAHLAGCAACRAEADLIAVARRALPAGPAIEVRQIVAALPAPPAATPSGQRSAPGPAWRSWRAAAAAAAVALVVGGSTLVLRDQPRFTGGRIGGSGPADSAHRGTVGSPGAATLADQYPILTFADAEDLTAAEYDALVAELESDSDLFTPVAEPAAEPVLGGAP